MYGSRSDRAYRFASTDAETQIDFLLLSYDALALHLRLAGDAVEQRNIPVRCDESNRALTILGHIETWIEYLDEPSLSASLGSFYQWLRGQILASQTAPSRSGFDDLSTVVLELRATWQTKRKQILEGICSEQAFPSEKSGSLHTPRERQAAKWCA